MNNSFKKHEQLSTSATDNYTFRRQNHQEKCFKNILIRFRKKHLKKSNEKYLQLLEVFN